MRWQDTLAYTLLCEQKVYLCLMVMIRLFDLRQQPLATWQFIFLNWQQTGLQLIINLDT